jgi:hypothetical protein
MKAIWACIVRYLPKRLFTLLTVLMVILCMGGAWTGSGRAYVLQGPQILSLMAHEIGGLKTLRVYQKVTVLDPTISAEAISFDETLNYIFPDRFRSEILHQNTRRIHVFSKGQALTVVGDTISSDPEAHYDLYKDLLLFDSAFLLEKTLYIHGIDVEITSLGRLGDRVVFVIGARYPDESVSQVWVDQESFVPLRWLSVQQVSKAAQQEDRWDFHYSLWQKVGHAHYPFQVETFHNQQLIRRIRVTKVDPNTDVDGRLFDIAQLRSTYRPAVTPAGPGEQPPPGLEDVQRTIDEFKKKFEP